MQIHTKKSGKQTGRKLLALLLCAVVILSAPFIPGMPGGRAQAAEVIADWLRPHLEKTVEWGVVVGDDKGNMRADAEITRAEFVAMLNRAYGFRDLGPIPFTDVRRKDWFYEDIAKAYRAGIFSGTSATTASPRDPVTREQAVALLSRNMRLDRYNGEVTSFTDGRDFSTFSRTYVHAAVRAGFISGYTDGTFKPLKNITRGEAIRMISSAVGTLIQESGNHVAGGVFGNMTINTTNVTLKDTIIAGDLYISGGIGLGDVVLENVQVLGRIVIAGGGSSEMGRNSVLLRGVEAQELVVDMPTGQYTSVRTEGRTVIQKTMVRSNGFLEDGCRDGYGFLNISLEAPEGSAFTLSGNLETIINRTPGSTLTIGNAQVGSLTVDESAVGSRVQLEINATVDNMNLDVATTVTGRGDIGHLTINSDGSVVEMLPDDLTIRPGNSADIYGENIDSSEAIEFSNDPRILSGYPTLKDISPTSATAVVQTNKSGTVYWGVTSAALGAVPDTKEGADRLISPSYGAGFLMNGKFTADESSTDYTTALTGLTANGTYFVSAVLVDVHGRRSPVYSEMFQTPDDTIPAFSSKDYPYMSKVSKADPQVTVMTNKDCDLYYVLLPQGSTPPGPNDFLSYTFSDPLGYGRIQLKKNKTDTVQVNDLIYPDAFNRPTETNILEEQKNYELYLWLTDPDGVRSSAVTQLTFTTQDETPPEFTSDMQQTEMRPNSVGVSCVVNEDATVYWALVPTGRDYPVPQQDSGLTSTDEEFLTSEYAKLQVQYGQRAEQSGNIRARGNASASATISRLQPETAYDIYYIAVDSAGNYSNRVEKLTVSTEDNTPPTAELAFSNVAEGSNEPYANTDVSIVFSENIMYEPDNAVLLTLYRTANNLALGLDVRAKAKEDLVKILRDTMKLYRVSGNREFQVVERTEDGQEEWGIDYRNVTLSLERDGKLTVTFPTNTADTSLSALNLGSGTTYFFRFQNLADATPAKNVMEQRWTNRFTTVSALAHIGPIKSTHIKPVDTSDPASDEFAIDIGFSVTPDSTNSSDEGLYWDMRLWLDTTSKFDLYRRIRPEDITSNEGWEKVGDTQDLMVSDLEGEAGISLVRVTKPGQNPLPFLVRGTAAESLDENKVYEFAIHFTELNNNSQREAFNGTVNCGITIITGSNLNVSNMSIVSKSRLLEEIAAGTVTEITSEPGYTIPKEFTDLTPPALLPPDPTFTAGDSGVSMTLSLERVGTVYYVIAPENALPPRDSQNNVIPDIPTGEPDDSATQPGEKLVNPTTNMIVKPSTIGTLQGVVSDSVEDVGRSSVTLEINGLSPKTKYYAYLVTQGGSNRYSEVYVYTFTTTEIVRPALTLQQNGSVFNIRTDLASTTEINYIIVPYSSEMGQILYGDFTYTPNPGDAEQKLKVYEAMSRTASSPHKGSVYDNYATDTEARRTVVEYIKSTAPDSTSIMAVGDGTATARQPLQVDCSNPDFKLSYGQPYCLIATGRSALSNEENPLSYAFRSFHPFYLSDPEAPKVSEAMFLPADGNLENDRICGDLVLSFDKNLYCLWTDSDGMKIRRTVTANTAGIGGTNPDTTYISAASLKNGVTSSQSVNIAVDPSQQPQATSVLTINFNKAQSGQGIVFTNDLCNVSQRTRSPALSVTAHIVTNRDGTKAIEIKITPGWDARESK